MNGYDAMMGNGTVGDTQILRGLNSVGDPAVNVAEVDRPGTYTNNGAFTAMDRIELGFTPDQAGLGTTLAPGASLEFTAECTTPFKPEQLIIDSAQAGDLTIMSINANAIQYVDGGPVQATSFSEVSTARFVSWGTVQTSGKIKIVLRNDGAAAFAVRMSVRGLRLRGQ